MNIIDYIPYGHENAITRKQLEQLTRPDRSMRDLIKVARKEHAIMNLQDGKGYFRPLPEERPLVERWVRQEDHRERETGNSKLGAEKWLTGGAEGNTIAVHGYVRHRHKITEPEKQLEGQMRL